MEKIISFILSVGLVIIFSFLTTEKIFPQTFQDKHTSDTTTVITRSDGDSSDTPVKGITPMRARSLIGVVLGLASLVIGLIARRRAIKSMGSKGRNGAIAALSMGAIAVVLSIIHLGITAGAVFGSGSGKAGAIFALILSLVGIIFSGLVLRHKKS